MPANKREWSCYLEENPFQPALLLLDALRSQKANAALPAAPAAKSCKAAKTSKAGSGRAGSARGSPPFAAAAATELACEADGEALVLLRAQFEPAPRAAPPRDPGFGGGPAGAPPGW